MLRAAVVAWAGCALPLCAQYAPANAEWNRPIAPVKIAGNLYYVGPSGVSSFLFTTSQGHILLDTGYRETVPIIESNLKQLGFRFEDIRLILVCHAHNEHAGGVAEIKRRTHARFLASPGDAPLLARGGKGDFALADRYRFPPVEPDGLLRDGEPVGLGGTQLTPHFTPGHTKGCTSWTTTVQEGAKVLRVVIPCSVSAPGYQLVNNPKYPEIQKDFEASFAKLRALPCDIFLTEHSWDFDLPAKIQSEANDPSRNAFIDPEGYRRYLDRAQAAFQKQVEEQKAKHAIPQK
jgi:metallo-beta-lactamase class B